MKEANELLEIWQRFDAYYKKEYRLRFWHLKAKIDDLKKQIIAFAAEIDRLEKGRERKLIIPKNLLNRLTS